MIDKMSIKTKMERLLKAKQGQSGVTLIELMVVVFIFVLVMAVMAVFFDYFFDSYYFTFDQGRSIDEVKVSVDRFSREVREAQSSQEGAYPLQVANDQEISFYSDVDNDGQVEFVRYFLSGNNLMRGVIEPGSPPNVYSPGTEATRIISEYVRNGVEPVFYYYNGSWPSDVVNNPLVLADRLLETRLVEINLMINTSPNTQDDLEVSTRVMIRNLKTNY